MDAHEQIERLERHFGRSLNQHERLAATLGEIVVAVLGRIVNDRPEFILAPLDENGGPLSAVSDADVLKARLHAYGFVGIFAYANGVADASCERDPESWRVLCAAVPAWFAYLGGKLAPQVSKGDTGDWLKELWAKPDTREN